MKRILFIIAILTLSLANRTAAQETDTVKHKKKGFTIAINMKEEGPGGAEKHSRHKKHMADSTGLQNEGLVESSDEDSVNRNKFNAWEIVFDLGINTLRDNTDYTNPAAKSYLNVPANRQNSSLFDLRTAKSVNVNIYPWMVKFRALKTHGQRIYISTGVGLQLYNFRYENPLTYTRNPSGVIIDSMSFLKDKLALDYVNVPLMFTFKTRLHSDGWLVYGVGITEGYLLDSWTKQKSDAKGKVKVHDNYGLSDFNTCLSAEIGVDGIVRFFATYQLNSLYKNGLYQHPVSIGLRLVGI